MPIAAPSLAAYDSDREEFYFLEVNTRIQVEHGVTEAVTGIDLVEWMVRLAGGDNPIVPVTVSGASIQVRLYAESPLKDFAPSPGLLSHRAAESTGVVDDGHEPIAFLREELGAGSEVDVALGRDGVDGRVMVGVVLGVVEERVDGLVAFCW